MLRYWGEGHAASAPPEAPSLPPLSSAARSRRYLPPEDEPLTRDPSA